METTSKKVLMYLLEEEESVFDGGMSSKLTLLTGE